MTKKTQTPAPEALLAQLHSLLAEDFLQKLRDGTMTAADRSTLRQFLKDNGIESLREKDETLDTLADELDNLELDAPLGVQ